jgi:hypothetical protein
LDVVLGLRPPQRDLSFAELDALYMHILASVEDIDPVLEILCLPLFCFPKYPEYWSVLEIEEFLLLQPGDAELYLGDLSSLIDIGPTQRIHILHASLVDFHTDPKRSKGFWLNPRVRHTSLARRCIHFLLQHKGK